MGLVGVEGCARTPTHFLTSGVHMPAGRRGRPYQVPDDTSSIRSARVDVDARVGWLLLMSRLHHPDPGFGSGESFNAALQQVGLRADRSAVSRWESGKVTPRYQVLMAYEQALGLSPGHLTSVVNALRRSLGGEDLPAWAPVLDVRQAAFHDELDRLTDAIVDDDATGAEWLSFGHHVAAAKNLYLHRDVWRHLAGRLVQEMSLSVGVAYLQRFEAMRLLLEHRVAQRWLLEAVGAFLNDPAVQVINDPVGVLEISRAPEAAEIVLDTFFTTESAEVLWATSESVAIKIEAGDYDEDEISRIELSLGVRLKEPGASAGAFSDLIMALPRSAQQRLLRDSRAVPEHDQLQQAAIHGERFEPETTRKVSARLASAVRSRLSAGQLYDDDEMTPRLIREALFAARGDRTHYASIFLHGSPMRGALAAVLAAEIDRAGLEDPLTPRFARLLRYVVTVEQEEAMLGWLPRASGAVARDFARALGHMASRGSLAALTPLLEGSGPDTILLDRALLYGLGMRQDPSLAAVAADLDRSEPIRAGAAWWLRQGGAVRR